MATPIRTTGGTPPSAIKTYFAKFSARASWSLGSFWVFALACGLVIAWFTVGPIYHFSDTWQLVMNTISSIVTFLMVFMIQNTQNRDSRAINLKLDELIRAVHDARDEMIDIESLPDNELEVVGRRYERIREELEQRRKRHVPPAS